MAVSSSNDRPPSWPKDDCDGDPIAVLVHEVESNAGSCTNALKQLELSQLTEFVDHLEKRLTIARCIACASSREISGA